MERNSAATGRSYGLMRYRWVPVVLIALVLILVGGLVLLDRAVSRKTHVLQDTITEENLQNAGTAQSNAAAFERYLGDGARGEHVIDGPALHRFIEMRYGAMVPDSVGAWRIVLHDGLAAVEGVVDLERYLREMGMEQPASLDPMLGQEIPFGFSGRLETEEGRGRFFVQEVTLLGLPLPLELVERMAAGNSGGSVLIQQFPLPGGIGGARIVADKVVINGGQQR